ncbi:MAG: YybH family protein [Gemmatimonadota bacterium]
MAHGGDAHRTRDGDVRGTDDGDAHRTHDGDAHGTRDERNMRYVFLRINVSREDRTVTSTEANRAVSAPERVAAVLERWAEATRTGRRDRILAEHEPDAVIYDVLPPMKYVGVEAYRKSWDEWQPDAETLDAFDLYELELAVGSDVAFAHGLLHCAGTTSDGVAFEDRVRATFCLRRHGDRWLIAHQHVSIPRGGG